MGENKCPICGGILVWDYERGEITCSSCGTVIDTIYDYSPPYRGEDTIYQCQTKKLENPKHRRQRRQYYIHIRRYNTAQKYVIGRPWLHIDYDKYLHSGKLVKTIKSDATINAEKNIEELGIRHELQYYIKLIERIYPAALARTERSKYALAYILSFLDKKRRPPLEHRVTEIFNISPTSYKRLLRLAKKIHERIKPANINPP